MLNNFIKISPNSIIYIVIPNIVTGGPEALHQLGLELKKKFDVRIYYWPFFNNNFLYQKYKIKFINSCDAMLHGRSLGESFGIACGEFAIRNKPIFTYNFSRDRAHIDLLKKKIIIE